MPRSRLPPDSVVANLDLGPARIGVIPKDRKIALGDWTLVRDSQDDTVDCITKSNDLDDGLGVTEQFQVRFWSNQINLSSPSKKRLPAAEQLVRPLSQMFACGIAEVERQMSGDLMGNPFTRNESFGAPSGLTAFSGRFRHVDHITI